MSVSPKTHKALRSEARTSGDLIVDIVAEAVAKEIKHRKMNRKLRRQLELGARAESVIPQ